MWDSSHIDFLVCGTSLHSSHPHGFFGVCTCFYLVLVVVSSSVHFSAEYLQMNHNKTMHASCGYRQHIFSIAVRSYDTSAVVWYCWVMTDGKTTATWTLTHTQIKNNTVSTYSTRNGHIKMSNNKRHKQMVELQHHSTHGLLQLLVRSNPALTPNK